MQEDEGRENEGGARFSGHKGNAKRRRLPEQRVFPVFSRHVTEDLRLLSHPNVGSATPEAMCLTVG